MTSTENADEMDPVTVAQRRLTAATAAQHEAALKWARAVGQAQQDLVNALRDAPHP